MTLEHSDERAADANDGERHRGAAAVVLLTGAGETTPASWLPVRRRLEPDMRVVAYDRVGMAGEARAHTLDGYLTELESVLAGEPEPVVLVGHSFGGLLAQVYAERHPERVAGLVLVDATPQAVAGNRAVAAGFAVSATVATALKLLAPAGLVRLLLRLRALPLYPEQRKFEQLASADEIRMWKQAVDRDMRTATVTELRSVLPAALAAEILTGKTALSGVPVALITSNAYGPEWVRMHDAIAARYAGSRHHYTGDRHHNIHMVHPELVAEIIQSVVAASRS